MKVKNSKILKTLILSIIIILSTQTAIFAHSGRTDSKGGHKDNKNASGLGNYHYHCGGYPAHLHKNGVCPYKSSGTSTSSSKKSSKNSSTSKSKAKTSKKSTTTKTPTTTPTDQLETEPKTIEVNSVKIQNKIETLETGLDFNLIATIEPADATNKTITWSSSDTTKATIDSTGKVSAISEGTVTLIAKSDNGKEDSIELKIKNPIIEVESITLNKTDVVLQKGQSYTIIAVVNPTDAQNKDVKWESSNIEVVKIDAGKIITMSEGTAIITASTSNGTIATCAVTVEANKMIETVKIVIHKIREVQLFVPQLLMGAEVLY